MLNIPIKIEHHNYNIIRNREAIYLDTNIWINITQPRNENDEYLRFILTQLVDDKKIFCPLSFAIISELLKQNYESILNSSPLMDKLSTGFSYKMLKELTINEIEHFGKTFDKPFKKMSVERIYVPVIAYLSSTGTFKFPTENHNVNYEKMISDFSYYLSQITLTDLLKGGKEYYSSRIERDSSHLMDTNIKESYRATGGNKNKLRKIEEDYFASNFIIPQLQKELSLDRKIKFQMYLDQLPADKNGRKLTSLLKYLPTINAQIELYTLAGMNPGKSIKIADFFDLEHLFFAASYSDVFVTEDKWINHLLKNNKNLPANFSFIFLRNTTELLVYLSNKYLKNRV